MKKLTWIYQIRAAAIVAVVVCHQQNILHKSEIIQMITLYSVTTLVFLMGVTKSLSYKKYLAKEANFKIIHNTINATLSVVLSYIIATFFYTYIQEGRVINYNKVLENILSFGASPPFYFIEYYLLFSICAPLLYSITKKILTFKRCYFRVMAVLFFLVITWIIGYSSIGRFDILGQSYLFVYSAGLITGQIDINKFLHKKLFLILILLIVGILSTYRFYSARLLGIYNYAKGIDIICPKLQMNPPNLSIILYSFGVIGILYYFFEWVNNSKAKIFGGGVATIGKYSMDIFLWHLYIQSYLNSKFISMDMGIKKSLIYYTSMLFLPVVLRCAYNRTKKWIYNTIKI